jgi:penicillin amidase
MPGFDSTYNWQGMVPVDENPLVLNPARGYVSSANQRPVDSTYPYYMGGLFSTLRGLIINRKLDVMNYVTVADMQQLQTDNYNVLAEFARPLLLQYVNEATLNDGARAYLAQFKNWNLQNKIGETAPTIFTVFWRKFEEAIWSDEFEQTKLPLRWPDENALLLSIRNNPGFRFIDDVHTPEKETLNDITAAAFNAAVQDLDKLKAAGRLEWGKYKETGVRHLLGIQGFSRLNLPIGGGDEIINATRSTHGPSWRMVVSLTHQIEAYAVYPGGQSGNPGSAFYDNFVDTWVAGKYYKLMFLSREEANRSFKMRWMMTFAKA